MGIMISIVVYARNDEGSIEWCLRSLSRCSERPDREVIVIDDASGDRTNEIVGGKFPNFRLVTNHRAVGWVNSIRCCLPSIGGRIIAFLGAHCRAYPTWMHAVSEEMGKGYEVITGRGHHREHSLFGRFEAMTLHSDYTGDEPGIVPFIWDDNFAIRPELLGRALPRTASFLSDGAGAVLLSFRLKEMGIPIHYRPSVQIDHINHPATSLFAIWCGELARNAIAIKRAAPSLPAANLLRFWPAAAILMTGGRFIQDGRNILKGSRAFRMSIQEKGFHLGFLCWLSLIHFLGLCRYLMTKERMAVEGVNDL